MKKTTAAFEIKLAQVILVLLMLCSRGAWAQQVPVNGNGTPTTGREDGYLITGEATVKPSPEIYTYERQMPENDRDMYWSISGAKTIEGVPAEFWPEGTLRADEHPSVKIEWRDSIPGGRLALRYVNHAPVDGAWNGGPSGEVVESFSTLPYDFYRYLIVSNLPNQPFQ